MTGVPLRRLAIVFTLGFTLQLAVDFFQRMMVAAADGGHR